MRKAYLLYWRRYSDFEGVSSRCEYWWVLLVNSVFYTVFGIPAIIFFSLLKLDFALAFLIIISSYTYVTIIPELANTIRRLRDAGFKAWYILLLLLPPIGTIVLFTKLAKPSLITSNNYRPGEINMVNQTGSSAVSLEQSDPLRKNSETSNESVNENDLLNSTSRTATNQELEPNKTPSKEKTDKLTDKTKLKKKRIMTILYIGILILVVTAIFVTFYILTSNGWIVFSAGVTLFIRL
jgi:uncharacterized membrane protein YhaH (DUF805 family)